MKTTLFAAALLLGTAAMAQDVTDDTSDMQDSAIAPAASTTSTGTLVQPDNSNPERDARGIAVISDPANAPVGFNQQPAVGGPLVDASQRPMPEPATESYPPCSRTVTDNCVQTYERGRGPQG